MILSCHGQKTMRAFGVTTASKRRVYRLDGRTKTLLFWNKDNREFISWGDGTLDVDPSAISFVSRDRELDRGVREIHFDRESGNVTDAIINPYATLSFTGNCKPDPTDPKF